MRISIRVCVYSCVRVCSLELFPLQMLTKKPRCKVRAKKEKHVNAQGYDDACLKSR